MVPDPGISPVLVKKSPHILGFALCVACLVIGGVFDAENRRLVAVAGWRNGGVMGDYWGLGKRRGVLGVLLEYSHVDMSFWIVDALFCT